MRHTVIASLILSLMVFTACRQEEATPATEPAAQTASSLTPEQLGEIGGQIKKEPNRSQEILSQHGLNEQSFEDAIRQVTQDPDASKRYRDAYTRASA